MEWFTVDKEGLAKLLERKGKAFVLYELIQNAWDTDATEITVSIVPVPNRPYCDIVVVDDDPSGFSNLEHAFTLFADSTKKGDPEKRGRFNLGEKLVLSLCEEAHISTMSGTISFDKDGRHRKHAKTGKGSMFTGRVRMTRPEHNDMLLGARLLIAPHDKTTTINGEHLPERKKVTSFPVPLKTEVSDGEGILRPTVRSTLVSLHEPLDGEVPHLYEMGIPVVELDGGEPWHINVHQKVPLNADRDNVTPAYLRDLRTAVLNHTHKYIDDADAASKAWVRNAASDPKVTKEAVQKVMHTRFGENAVAFDPSDPEANKISAHDGRTVIPGGALSKEEWANVKRDQVVLPAGKVTPSRPEATAATRTLGENELTDGMRALRQVVMVLGKAVLGHVVDSRFIESPGASVLASYGDRTINFNVPVLGAAFFQKGVTEAQVDLFLHECGHEKSPDHLSKKYNDALTAMGAKLAFYIAEHPNFFKEHCW